MIEDSTSRKARELGAVSLAIAAKRLDVPTREIVEAVYYRRIRYIMIDGIAHIPEDALSEYREAS